MKEEHADRIRQIIAEENKGVTPPVMALARRVAHLEASEHGLSGRLETCRQDEEQLKSRIEQLERELAEALDAHKFELDLRIKLQAQLAAEKALADDLYKAWNTEEDERSDAAAAYRKARGL